MKEKHKAQWEKIRAIGKSRFRILSAILWATAMTIGKIIGDYFISSPNYGTPSPVFWFISNFIIGLLIAAPLWWNMIEGRYNNSKEK